MLDSAIFQSPPKEYAPVTFWSWNDDLQEEELIRQIGLMDEAGWGGFFMHARVGLETPYLSRRWFDCVRACLAEAGRRGMGAWLYDEDQWPSGFAGGIVSARRTEYRAQALWCLVDDKPTFIQERLGAWIARRDDGQLVDFRPAADPSAFDPAIHAWVQIYPVTASLNEVRHKGYCYVDVLNPLAVRAFIESTHERYAEQVGQAFGASIPGLFTDEPQYLRWNWYQGAGIQSWHQGLGAHILPWTGDLPQEFEKQNGYPLIPRLPSLFFDTGEYMEVRYDFWRTLTQRFVEGFTRPIGEWCRAHNLYFTGHFLREDSLADQIRANGAVMPHYEYMDVPGIDKLSRHIDQPITAKQLDSVVCQLGKPAALCEAYGCAGQDFSFTGRKWIGDHLYALGITLLNPHLSLYSMRGDRKRDFPPNLFYQQPWWPYNRQFDLYFTCLSYALRQGQRVVDVLVLHPIASAWTLYRPASDCRAARLSQELRKLNDTLLAAHRDYHFADETLLARYGRVEDGQLRLGKMSYRVFIIPPATTLAHTTVDLLQRFADAGGSIVNVGDAPFLINGRPAIHVLPSQTVPVSNHHDEVVHALDVVLPAAVSIQGEGAEDVIYHHRCDGSQHIFFLANQDLSVGRRVRLRVPGTGRLERWDLFTGQVEALAGRPTGGSTEIDLSFPAAGSHLLLMQLDKPALQVQPKRSPAQLHRLTLPDDWAFRRLDPNAMTLDTCALKLEGGTWSPTMPVWQAHRDLMSAGPGASFALRFQFQVDTPPTVVDVVLERPERYTVTVNGRFVSSEAKGYWRDISFSRLDVRSCIQPGQNSIKLEGRLREDTEVENVYLIGDFGVVARRIAPEQHGVNGMDFDRYAPQFALTGEAEHGSSRGLNQQGYPFFAGSLSLSQVVALPEELNHAVLALEGMHAALADVWLNGQHAGAILIPPYELDVSRFVRPGNNEIALHLVTSLRNLLGPLHRQGGDPVRIWPHDFEDMARWTDDYIFVPFGVDAVQLSIS
jgi:hypothetical protein